MYEEKPVSKHVQGLFHPLSHTQDVIVSSAAMHVLDKFMLVPIRVALFEDANTLLPGHAGDQVTSQST